MTYEEFEWHILRLVYEEGVERIQPAYLAYALGIPHETATEYLDRATQNGVVEMDVTEDGSIEYFIPGASPDNPMPSPVWKEGGASDRQQDEASETTSDFDESERAGRALLRATPDEASTSDADPVSRDERVASADDGSPMSGRDAPEADGAVGAESRSNPAGADAVVSDKVPTEPPEDTGADGTLESPRKGGPGTTVTTKDKPDVPPEFRDHIKGAEQRTDGTLDPSQGGRLTVVDKDATVEEGSPNGRKNVLQALEDSDRDLPIRIESTDETFSDPSQTIFMRQLRVEGVESEAALREHIHRLFESLGYNVVENENDRMRFERGSVTFILALVPLFVLVLPLFVYLFLYCMGRSTIHQEPLELDVQLRRSAEREDVYEIDLTFIGLHGVVLGAADQRVLNKEVDTLRDELQWALTTG